MKLIDSLRTRREEATNLASMALDAAREAYERALQNFADKEWLFLRSLDSSLPAVPPDDIDWSKMAEMVQRRREAE